MKKTKIVYKKELDASQLDYETQTFIQPLKRRIPTSASGRMRGIKLPRYITFTISNKILELYIQEQVTESGITVNATCCNMQTDNAAFEGWAVVFKSWFPDLIDKVVLKWDIPSMKLQNKHYNRFLYRCLRFQECYHSWFSIDSSNQACVEEFKANCLDNLSVNVSKSEPEKKSNNENTVEYEFSDKNFPQVRNQLMESLHLDIFNHQLHVGVRQKGVSFFPGGQSAIDLWGINEEKKSLSIIELKYIDSASKVKNIKVGIISELFLYTCIMCDIIKGTISYGNAMLPDEQKLYSFVHEIHCVNGIMFSNEFHPLIENKNVIDILNASDVHAGQIKVVFSKLHYDYKLGSYNFSFKHI